MVGVNRKYNVSFKKKKPDTGTNFTTLIYLRIMLQYEENRV